MRGRCGSWWSGGRGGWRGDVAVSRTRFNVLAPIPLLFPRVGASGEGGPPGICGPTTRPPNRRSHVSSTLAASTLPHRPDAAG